MKKIYLFIVLCVLAFPAFDQGFDQGGPTAPRMLAINYIKAGDWELQKGNWEGALREYSNAIEVDNTFAEAYMKRGQLLEKTTRTQEAMRDYAMAIQLNPFVEIYYDEQMRLLLLSSNYMGALKNIYDRSYFFDSAIDSVARSENFITFKDYELLINTASIENNADMDGGNVYSQSFYLIQQEEFEKARNLLKEHLKVDSTHFLTYDLLGIIELSQENWDLALNYFDISITKDPTQFISFYNAAVTARFLNRPGDAMEYLNRAIDLNNNEAIYFYKRALILKESGAYSEAIDEYDRAIQMDSNFVAALYNRAFTNQILGNYWDALKDIELALIESYDQPLYWNLKGNLTLMHGDYFEAIYCFDQALSYDGRYAEGFYNRGIANLLANRPMQACEDFHMAIELDFPKAELMMENFCGF